MLEEKIFLNKDLLPMNPIIRRSSSNKRENKNNGSLHHINKWKIKIDKINSFIFG